MTANTRKLTIAAIGVATIGLIANPAKAINITLGGTSISGLGQFSNVSGATTIDFESGAPTSGLAVYSLPSGRTGVVSDLDQSVPRSDLVRPQTSSLWRDNNSQYLRIGSVFPNDEPVEIDFTKSLDYFGLYWEGDSASHVGRYGNVSFYNDDSLIGEFDWHDVADIAGQHWGSLPDSYVNFHADPEESFNKVVLNATWWAQFESDNHAYRVAASSNTQSVPEPSSAIALLGIGALSLGSKRKRIKKGKIC